MPETAGYHSQEGKEARRQKSRLHVAKLVVASMLLETVMLALFATTDNAPMWVPPLFFVFGAGSSVLVCMVFKSGFNLGLQDKNLVTPQLILNALIQLGFMLLAPKLAIVFLVALIVLSAFAAIDFTPPQFTMGWLLYGIVTVAMLWLIRDDFSYPGTRPVDIVQIWIFFFLALRSLTWASARFSTLRDKLSEKNRQLEESLCRIEEMASRDHLTGVLNRGNLMQALEAELQRSARSGQPFCFVMLDLDLLKTINDRHGHPVGDQVLKMLCDIAARQSLRAIDRVGRLGGEEFAIVLPGATLDNGMISMECLRLIVAGYDWESVACMFVSPPVLRRMRKATPCMPWPGAPTARSIMPSAPAGIASWGRGQMTRRKMRRTTSWCRSML